MTANASGERQVYPPCVDCGHDSAWFCHYPTDKLPEDAVVCCNLGYHPFRAANASGERLTYDTDAETIDEVVLRGADVHLERLSDEKYMLIVNNAEHWWHLEIASRSGRANVDAFVLEAFDGDDVPAPPAEQPADTIERALGVLEWSGVWPDVAIDAEYCPICNWRRDYGHTADCTLAAAIAEVERRAGETTEKEQE